MSLMVPEVLELFIVDCRFVEPLLELMVLVWMVCSYFAILIVETLLLIFRHCRTVRGTSSKRF